MSLIAYGSLDFEEKYLMISIITFSSLSLIPVIFLQLLFSNLCCPSFVMLYISLLATFYLLTRAFAVYIPVWISLSNSTTVSVHNIWFFYLKKSVVLVKLKSFLWLELSTLFWLQSCWSHSINSASSISRW